MPTQCLRSQPEIFKMDSTWWKSAQELDDDQRAIIEIPTADGNYLVTGPPGCGKTNILLLRASYLRSAGFGNCVVLAFTRTLREFIAAGSNKPSMLPTDRIKTHASWTRGLLRELDRPYSPSKDDLTHDQARYERHQVLGVAVEERRLTNNHFDSILIDEVQDYWACEIKLLSRLTRRIFAVGDSRQRIYDRNEGIQTALDVGCVVHQLRYHYRMGPKICRVADRLLPAEDAELLEEYCQYDDRERPSRVSVHQTGNLLQQLEKLVPTLDRQLRAYPNEWLGVIAVRSSTRDTIAESLIKSKLGTNVVVQSDDRQSRTFDPGRRIVVSTLHSVKGTEFRSLHFLAADDFPFFTREKAFTAVTRAKTTLDVYHSRPLNGALESALAEPQVPDLDGIFT